MIKECVSEGVAMILKEQCHKKVIVSGYRLPLYFGEASLDTHFLKTLVGLGFKV